MLDTSTNKGPVDPFVFVVGWIYYFAPNAKVRLRDVWVGALLAGALAEATTEPIAVELAAT